jgi:hypothetical protein
MFYGGEINVPGAPGNLGTVPNTGGMPNRPVDKEFLRRLQQPGTPPPPGFREQFGLPPAPGANPQAPQAVFGQPGMIAGAPSFDINRSPGALGGRSGEQLKRLYEGGTQQNEQLNQELRRRGIMPGGPQLPLAQGGVPMGNAGFFASNQYGQQLPPGYVKTVS